VEARHLIDLLMEIGPTVPSGFGPVAIGWREIEAWQAVSGVELAPWEAGMIRRLSGEYAAELHAAEDEDRPAPYLSAAVVAANREAVERKLELLFG